MVVWSSFIHTLGWEQGGRAMGYATLVDCVQIGQTVVKNHLAPIMHLRVARLAAYKPPHSQPVITFLLHHV